MYRMTMPDKSIDVSLGFRQRAQIQFSRPHPNARMVLS
jgi:hypothetical protein